MRFAGKFELSMKTVLVTVGPTLLPSYCDDFKSFGLREEF